MKGIVYNIQRMSTKDGPGVRTTVFLKGCPLKCAWCGNPESQSVRPQLLVFSKLCSSCGACEKACPHGAIRKTGDTYNRDRTICSDCGECVRVCPTRAREISGKEMSVEEVMKIVDSDSLFYENSGGGVTFGGGEPTAQSGFLHALIGASRKRGYHVTLDTSGYCAPERFNEFIPEVDLFLFDSKHMDPETHRRMTGVDNRLILENLSTVLSSGQETRIRVPLIPGVNDSEENVGALANFLKSRGKQEVDILPCHAFGYSKYAALNIQEPAHSPYAPKELDKVLDRFRINGLKVTIVD